MIKHLNKNIFLVAKFKLFFHFFSTSLYLTIIKIKNTNTQARESTCVPACIYNKINIDKRVQFRNNL